MGRERIELQTAESTVAFGISYAQKLKQNSVLALKGGLGAGKTTFVQGLLQGLGIQDTAQSPTFTYLQIYENVFHFDLYRLKNEQDFVLLGFEEFLMGGITVIEWPERIPNLLPKNTQVIELSYLDRRRIAEYEI